MAKNTYAWGVIGAGPAGIAAVGLLLDHGVRANDILWVDPHFQVGDLGGLWHAVSSNTSVQLFHEFLNGIQAFEYASRPQPYDIDSFPPENTCDLKYIAEPLQWVTTTLKNKVKTEVATITHLSRDLGHWTLDTGDKKSFHADKLILATGSTPKSLNYAQYCRHEISVTEAMNKSRLAKQVNQDDVVAVFGSSHSAMIIIRDLLDCGIKAVVNFYQSPIKFAVKLDDWILYDNTGLKGETARWVRENIFLKRHPKLKRFVSNEDNIQRELPLCSQVIYAVGFMRRTPISTDINLNNYDLNTGIIAPGLFGAGIGFPRQVFSPMGHIEMNVGLWKFMNDMRLMMPLWLRYGVN